MVAMPLTSVRLVGALTLPPPTAAQLIVIPATGLLFASVTITESGARTAPAAATWLSPPFFAICVAVGPGPLPPPPHARPNRPTPRSTAPTRQELMSHLLETGERGVQRPLS